MKTWGSCGTGTSTTATTSTSRSPWPPSTPYVPLPAESLAERLSRPSLNVRFVQQTKLKHPDYQPMAKESLQLAVHFLLHTYLHTKKKLRYVVNAHPASIPHLVGGGGGGAAESHPACRLSSLPAWTRRSGWPPWRCCCPRVGRRVSGWCSTWWDRRAERSPGLCLINQSISQSIKHFISPTVTKGSMRQTLTLNIRFFSSRAKISYPDITHLIYWYGLHHNVTHFVTTWHHCLICIIGNYANAIYTEL